jgi:hypothetical protein
MLIFQIIRITMNKNTLMKVTTTLKKGTLMMKKNQSSAQVTQMSI